MSDQPQTTTTTSTAVAFRLEPPAFALHYWNGERMLSHFDIAGPRHVLATYDSNLQPMIRNFIRERGTG